MIERPSTAPQVGTPWPTSANDLEAAQIGLAEATPPLWSVTASPTIAGAWFTSPTGSAGDSPGEPAWASAVSLRHGAIVAASHVRGVTSAGYRAGYLALRQGRLLEQAVAALPHAPDVLLVDATARDHPRRAGLALHLGAVLGLPTIGVTDRPLLATGPEPPAERWATSELTLDGELVAIGLRTRRGVRSIVVHPAWRTDRATALDVVRRVTERARTPEPLRAARREARLVRARDEGRLG
jgi:deoxyribonuclease V